MLPKFFIVGAQKSGTTALHHYLNEHPEIFLPSQKETKFFVDEKEYNKGIDYYEKTYFSGWKDEKQVGEIDPDYMYFNVAAERIAKHIPQSKIIFILRNPVDRAFSHYTMTYRRGLELFSFEESIKKEKSRIMSGYEGAFHYSYFARGYYFKQITQFLNLWDSSQVLFLLAEDLYEQPVDTVKKCFEFLDVDAEFIPAQINNKFHQATVPKSLGLSVLFRDKSAYPVVRGIARFLLPSMAWRNRLRSFLVKWNSKKSNLKLSEETRKELIEMYLEENTKLSELIGRDLSHWN